MSELVNNRSVEDIIALLSEPLDEDIIETRRGGGNQELSYIPVWRVIDQANRIFGFGGWSYEVLDTELVTNGTWKIYKARVQVTVPALNPSPSSDIGTTAIQADTMDGHDMALKGAVSDGMRRVFRKYGEQFGNSLYNKKRGHTTYHTPSQQLDRGAYQGTKNTEDSDRASQAQVGAIYTIAKKNLGLDEDAVKEKCRESFGVEPAQLRKIVASTLIKGLSEDKEWPKGKIHHNPPEESPKAESPKIEDKIPLAAAKQLKEHIQKLIENGDLTSENVNAYLNSSLGTTDLREMTIKQRAEFQGWIKEQTSVGPVGAANL